MLTPRHFIFLKKEFEEIRYDDKNGNIHDISVICSKSTIVKFDGETGDYRYNKSWKLLSIWYNKL